MQCCQSTTLAAIRSCQVNVGRGLDLQPPHDGRSQIAWKLSGEALLLTCGRGYDTGAMQGFGRLVDDVDLASEVEANDAVN